MRLISIVFLFFFVIPTNAQITYVPNQIFRIYTTSPNVSIDILFDANTTSGTVTNVAAHINSVIIPAIAQGNNRYKATWVTNAYGTYSLRGVMTTSTGVVDSTFATNIKIIALPNCPIPAWDTTKSYTGGDYVMHSGSLYTANYWTQGNNPTASSAWTAIGNCSSLNYPTKDCSSIPVWDTSLIYGPSNTDIEVAHSGLVYRASQWTQALPPRPGIPWKIVGVCTDNNEPPVIQSAAVNNVFIQASLSNLPIAATITDTDGSIVHQEIIINGNSLPIAVSGNTYTVNWTAPAYGIYPIQIIAVDDELGTDTLNGTIQVATSTPPVISAVTPSPSKKIMNIYALNQDVLTLSADAVDPDGNITNVQFILNGQAFNYSSSSGNTYTYDWLPSAYGVYTLEVEATDNSGTISRYQSTFTLVNPLFENLTTSNLPLQVQANLGYDKVLDFGEAVTSVIVRNRDLLSATASGNQITISSNRTGRTGLKITTASGVYYMGVRINDCDGNPPGMPAYASIGFKSEDSAGDLQFWEDVDIDLTNKNMDVRYIYINDGPIGFNTWRTRQRAIQFCENSLKYGLIPFFVFYNIPDGGESFSTNLAHIRDTAYMQAYFKDLNDFMDDCNSIMDGDLFGVLLEPDFLGYLQQLGVINLGTNDPNLIQTCVGTTTIAPNAGTVRTLVERINKTISDKRSLGANVFFGWQLNLWSAGLNGSIGLMRRTDPSDLGWTAGRALIAQAATSTVTYGMNSGILTHQPDFISIDKYGLDAEGYSSAGVTTNPWWFNHDHWDNYMMYAKTMHQVSGMDMILWQLPVGRINGSHYQSAYTGNQHNDLTNTAQKYEDSTLDYFFGDKFTETDPTRFIHFTQNLAADSTLSSLNDTITWQQHIHKFDDCGIIHAMFGAGVGLSTDGIGTPAEDDYFSIQKIQEYYEDNLTFLSTAPFTTNTLTYSITQMPVDLKLIYSGSFNYAGKGVSSTGILNPMLLGEGIHYITFVIEENGCRVYKVQKIIINNNTLLSLTNADLLFEATAQSNRTVDLKWRIGEQADNDFFTVERSQQGIIWDEVIRLDGAGTTSIPLSYEATDDAPYQGTSYYRLVQNSFNQEKLYSPIRVVTLEQWNENKIQVFPNPTRAELRIEAVPRELEQVQVYNVLGKNLTTNVVMTQQTAGSWILNFEALPAGVYMIKTKTNTTSVLKE